MTLEELIEADEEPGYRYEPARGVVEVSEIPAEDHCFILHLLHEMMGDHDCRHPDLIYRIARGGEIPLLIPGPGTVADHWGEPNPMRPPPRPIDRVDKKIAKPPEILLGIGPVIA
jgi:hypothetical protein